MREVIESHITRGYVDQCVEFDFFFFFFLSLTFCGGTGSSLEQRCDIV